MTLRTEKICYDWKSRKGGAHPAVVDFSAEFSEGITHILCGPSGSGKTTLSLLLAGLIAPDSGEIRLDGAPIAERVSDVAYGFQFPEAIFFEESLRDEFARWTAQGPLEDTSYFRKLGMDYESIADRNPYQLSAGFGRLAAIALQLSRNPRVLILDEPTVGLDWEHKERLLAVLRDWLTPERMQLVITHDLETMRALGGHSWVMSNGELGWEGSTAELLASPDLLEKYSLLD
jgi:energy-coupling factor transporter ATP-binding protein EcfA2